MSNFLEAYDALSYLLEGKQPTIDGLLDLTAIGITSTNDYWDFKISNDFIKALNTYPDSIKIQAIKKLAAEIPRVTVTGKWPSSDILKGHRYSIVEIKLGNTKTGQPIRVFGFTVHLDDVRIYVLGSMVVHKEERLSKQERESCDNTYKEVYNLK